MTCYYTIALSLHYEIELLLDSGIIVIVPHAGDDTWKRVVLDESRYNDRIWPTGDGENPAICVKDLDGRVLKFLNSNRPRRRYLFVF